MADYLPAGDRRLVLPMKRLKSCLRWLILGFTLFFLVQTLKNNWQQITAVSFTLEVWLWLGISFLVTMGAHVWSGWIWSQILKAFKQPLPRIWALRVYLTTNIAKYLPGNIWHFYGRIKAVVDSGGTVDIASLTVLLEPLLMAAAALLMAVFAGQGHWGWQVLGLGIILVGIHPMCLNRAIAWVGKLKGRSTSVELTNYPWLLLGGEWCFLLLRGGGFLAAMAAFLPVEVADIPYLLCVFSLAWLLGLVVPGAPGGLGVFEATVIAALNQDKFPAGLVLTSVAVFRLVGVSAEAIAAFLAAVSLNPKTK